MKYLIPHTLLFIFLLAFCSCKKNSNEGAPGINNQNTINYRDSISFMIGEHQYVFYQKNSVGISNRPFNVKRSATAIQGGKLAYQTGGTYWYGAPDSTLYAVIYGFPSSSLGNNLELSFTKKYNDSELEQGPVYLQAKSHLDIFKIGELPFAVDYDKENTMDGMVIELNSKGKILSTKVPGFSILIRSALNNDIQNNSNFEITKIEHLKEDKYLIEAKFNANIFDGDENLYRIKNGFLRLTTYMTPAIGLIRF